jgi:hypothetical protein
MSRPWERVGAQGSGQFPMTQTQFERINNMNDSLDPFDKLANDISTAGSPFQLGRDWGDIQAGFAALMEWKKATDARLAALEARLAAPAAQKPIAGAGV